MSDRPRFATRFLLMAEVCLGFVSLSWAMGGVAGSGSWAVALAKTHGMFEWAVILGIIGTGQIGVACAELCCGRAWSDRILRNMAETRHSFAFLAMLCWCVLLYAYLRSPDSIRAVALVMQATFLVVANSVVMVNNKRLSVLLDPDIPTEQLRERLIKARNNGKMVL